MPRPSAMRCVSARPVAADLDLFENAFRHAAIGMALVALEGRFIKVNRSLCRLVGYRERELLATDFQTLTHPDDLDADLALRHRLLAGDFDSYQMEKRYLHNSGRVVWALLNVSLVRDADGEPLHAIAQIQDVTDRKRTEELLRAESARFGTLIRCLPTAMVVQDESRTILLANEAFCRLFEIDGPPELLIGLRCPDLARTAAVIYADPAEFLRRLEEIVARRAPVLGERLRLADGRTLERDYQPVFVEDCFVGHLWSLRDVTNQVEAERFNAEQTHALERSNAALRTLAATDALTGLPNRRALQERLIQAVASAARHGRPMSLLLADADRFKAYNDSFGHPAGDAALRTLGEVLRRASREADLPARFGGEEFAVLLPDTDVAGAIVAAERCRRAIESEPWPLRPLTASFGAATLNPEDAAGRSSEERIAALIAAADAALYAAKSAGRNRVIHAAAP